IPVTVTDRKCVNKNLSTTDPAPEETREADYSAPDAKVLAVDDNETNLMIVKFFLKRVGIEPELCSNGNAAIEKCRETKYDLILLDHMMPDPDGMETLEMIRNDAGSLNTDTPALILTANAMTGSRQMYMEAGFADYLTKPIDSAVLEQTVKRFLPEEKIIPV
ncbi:MAG: response regulator, partial [Lachnospiraceae bacterium]|nr:response regulator [Lachnospiraceae bacterium]